MFEETSDFMSVSERFISAEQRLDGTEHGVNVVINLAPHEAPGSTVEILYSALRRFKAFPSTQ